MLLFVLGFILGFVSLAAGLAGLLWYAVGSAGSGAEPDRSSTRQVPPPRSEERSDPLPVLSPPPQPSGRGAPRAAEPTAFPCAIARDADGSSGPLAEPAAESGAQVPEQERGGGGLHPEGEPGSSAGGGRASTYRRWARPRLTPWPDGGDR